MSALTLEERKPSQPALPQTTQLMEQYLADLRAKHLEYENLVAWGVRVTTAWERDRMQSKPKLTLITNRRKSK